MRIMRIALIPLVVVAVGCGKSESTDSKPSTTATAASTVAAAKPAPEAKAEPKAEKPKPTPKKSFPQAKRKHAVPDAWDYLVENKRGYGFAVPEGTKDSTESKDGVDVYVAELPSPHKVQVFSAAYKDRTRTLDELREDAEAILKALGNTDVKIGDAEALTDDYALAEATCRMEETEWKLRVLLATDVTDNYVLMVGAPTSEFSQSEETIDTIWGSFAMFSGGASGES